MPSKKFQPSRNCGMKNLLDDPAPTRLTSKPQRRITKSQPRRFNRIVVPIDFSRPSLNAAGAAQEQMRVIAARSNARYSVRVVHGSPGSEICNAANEDADLIVISTHGRTGLSHLLIGSVAERVVRYAHCPVLVISAPLSRVQPQPPNKK